MGRGTWNGGNPERDPHLSAGDKRKPTGEEIWRRPQDGNDVIREAAEARQREVEKRERSARWRRRLPKIIQKLLPR